jgi:hypothetical protein
MVVEVGEVIGGVVEVAADVLADIGADAAADAFEARRRRRRGCWRLFLIVLAIALIVGTVIALTS